MSDCGLCFFLFFGMVYVVLWHGLFLSFSEFGSHQKQLHCPQDLHMMHYNGAADATESFVVLDKCWSPVDGVSYVGISGRGSIARSKEHLRDLLCGIKSHQLLGYEHIRKARAIHCVIVPICFFQE